MNDCHSISQGFLPPFSSTTQALVTTVPQTHSATNKGALSFILSSSSSPDSEFQAAVVALVKRKHTRTALAKRPSPKAQSSSLQATDSCENSFIKKSSKFCVVDGCMSRAKHAKRCWRHGGSVKCKVTDCDNRAKSKGVCWSHGGGTLCTFQGCDTISVSHGFCWAHGGGKRCAVYQCSKPAYERTQNYCTAHFEEFAGTQLAQR